MYILSIAIAFGLFKMPPLFPALGNLWGVSTESLGMLQTIFGIGGAVMALPAAVYILPKIGAKKLGLLCGAMAVMGNVMIGTFASFEVALIGRLIEGIGFGGCMLFPIVLISRWFSSKERGKAIGIWAPFAPVAALIIFLLGPQLLKLGWTAIPWTVSIFTAICALLFFFIVKQGEEKIAPMRLSGGAVWRALANRELWFIGITWFTYNYFLVSLTSFAPTYFETVLGISNEFASAMAIIPVAMQIWAAPIWGAISDRIKSLKKTILLGGTVSFGWSMLIPFFSGSVGWWIFMFIILGFFWSSLAPACFAASTIILEESMIGLSVGVVSLLLCLSILIGPLVTGLLIPVLGWTWALTLTGALMAVGVITSAVSKIS
ncbi:MAG: MFS transporter [Candidatus Hadarchaeales archaeon]